MEQRVKLWILRSVDRVKRCDMYICMYLPCMIRVPKAALGKGEIDHQPERTRVLSNRIEPGPRSYRQLPPDKANISCWG